MGTSPARAGVVVRRFVLKPGEGPTKEAQKKERIEYRGVAVADLEGVRVKRAFCKAKYDGGMYFCGFFFPKSSSVGFANSYSNGCSSR